MVLPGAVRFSDLPGTFQARLGLLSRFLGRFWGARPALFGLGTPKGGGGARSLGARVKRSKVSVRFVGFLRTFSAGPIFCNFRPPQLHHAARAGGGIASYPFPYA